MIKPEALFKPVLERSSLDRPLDHLMACHRRIEERLEVMERAAAHLGDLRAEALAAFAPAEEQGWIQNVRGLVERLSAHYRRHIASEDETLQNYASGLLGAEALTEIAAEMRARRK